MAYSDQMDQYRMDAPAITGVGIAITGGAGVDLGVWAPGLQPVEVRGFAFVVTTVCTVTPPVLNLYKQVSPGVEAARVLIKSITGTLAQFDTVGKVIYADIDGTAALNATVNPGEAIQAEIGVSPTAGAGFCVIMVQPKWQQPANNTRMSRSTT